MKWNSSSHPISDLRDWNAFKRLEIRPKFQRGEVWTNAAKIMLMDSILSDIPMPKIFFQSVIRELDTYRIVIDGQQRISAILSFLNDDYKLDEPYRGAFKGLKFSQLPDDVKKQFLSYKIDINEIIDATEELVREIYSRVNKYTIALSKQELRRADYPGDFLKLSEELALDNYFEEAKVFTVANRRRMGDVEFVSELIALLIAGAQDKKETLDYFYQHYAKWDNQQKLENEFKDIIADLKLLFPDETPISKSRFKQKADLYSMFAAIHDLHNEGHRLVEKNLINLRADLKMLDELIAPESDVTRLSEYAIKCVSQGNSFSSREWRKKLLKSFLQGTYANTTLPSAETRHDFHQIIIDIDSSINISSVRECPVCLEGYYDYSKENVFLTWSKVETEFQLSNSIFIHNKCKDRCSDYYTIDEG